MVTALSIAKRHLVFAKFFSWTLPKDCEYALDDYGGFIGVYDSGSGRIFFFEDCFVVGEHCKHIIYYVCYKGRVEQELEKTNVKGFTILVKDGSQVWLPVSGFKPPKFWDSFIIFGFISRVAGLKIAKSEEERAKSDVDSGYL